MRLVKVSGGEFTIRETIKELPINRFTDFQRYIMQDAGIGSGMASVETRFSQLHRFIAEKKIEEAAQEAYNLHYSIHLAINKISIRHCSFVTLVDSVEGLVLTDYSEENLRRIALRLGEMGLTEDHVIDILESVKKNSILI